MSSSATNASPATVRALPELEEIVRRIRANVPEARIEIQANSAVAEQASLVVDIAHATDVARFLRDDESLRLDLCSNVTGVDWLEREVSETVKRTETVDGEERIVEESVKRRRAGYIEVVYHLYSTVRRHGPLVLRQRTGNRAEQNKVASLTPIYRSAEFQEREVFDLFGVRFVDHPDLRRILMWDEFADHPMRKDYVEPDDYEYEPTPHAEVLSKARRHYPIEGVS